MPPSQLAICTSSLQRLVKEEASYFKEVESQKKRIAKLEAENPNDEPEDQRGNREFTLKQERRALEETKAMIPTMRERIANAREKLQAALESAKDEAEIEKAKTVLKGALEAQKNDPDSHDRQPE